MGHEEVKAYMKKRAAFYTEIAKGLKK